MRTTNLLISAGLLLAALPTLSAAQTLLPPWNGYARDPQHSAVSKVASQHLNKIHWHTPVDQNPQYSGGELLIHYGSPLVTALDTVIVPVRNSGGGYQVEAHKASDGTLLWKRLSDYILPPHGWTPVFGPVLTISDHRLYMPGVAGSVIYRDNPDQLTGHSEHIVFYGQGNYFQNPSAYAGSVFINTPIASDKHGSIYFGVQVTGSTPLGLQSGLVRITNTGVVTEFSTGSAGWPTGALKLAHNCAPALSHDESTVYFAVNNGDGTGSGYNGYLLGLDTTNSTTMSVKYSVHLLDPASGQEANVIDDGSATPMVGPNGDVFYGVLETPWYSNRDRGWMLHFDPTLATEYIPGQFGWDDTASVVSHRMVTSYTGSSDYLLMTKYNNYAGTGGDGDNKIAILDPVTVPLGSAGGPTTMPEILTIHSPTPNPALGGYDEWCINTAAVDPIGKCVIANCEDGVCYKWDLTGPSPTGTLSESIVLTSGLGEAYTPTVIGPDGTVYAINNATLFAIGN